MKRLSFQLKNNEDDRPIILMTSWDLTDMHIQEYEPEAFLMFLTITKISACEAERLLTWESGSISGSWVYHLLTLRKPLNHSEPPNA